MTHTPHHRLLATALAALTFTACGDSTRPTAATEYWAQPDSVIIGLGRPSDVKAQSRDRVWVADRESAIILSLAPGSGEYTSIGRVDLEPTEVELPGKLAVSSDIGLSAYDIQTGSVDLFTFSGEFIRGFTPGFVPAVMSFSKAPIGYTFGIAAADSTTKRAAPADSAGTDSTFVRHALIIHTDLQGGGRDTLLSPTHGPEALRDATAGAGETLMSPSTSGMWVWSQLVPDTVFDVTPKGTRRLPLRSDESPFALFADPAREILWVLHPDTSRVVLAAYDTGGAIEPGAADAVADTSAVQAAVPFLGVRTIDGRFRPAVIHDGVVMGFRPIPGGATAMSAYDLHTERFEREP